MFDSSFLSLTPSLEQRNAETSLFYFLYSGVEAGVRNMQNICGLLIAKMEPPFLSLKTMEHIRSGSLHPDTDEVSKAYIQTIVPSLSPQGKGWGNICRVFSQNNQSVLLDSCNLIDNHHLSSLGMC
ncbi:hypothetical protein IGI04_038096 [Brassica rapa subsp. trilocularis]|uniref:Uncharacterized protein n=1 Tax=Brassica rapa subsp. trilocularis TaxID=1813537 RepID=A0ABQ7LJ91_BRACM|nr:hypothetical protein IGI04_038096 [Brassica rapa subsp. trilocularis]